MTKIAIVTGGAQGIGRAIIHHFLEKGWRAVALDKDAEAVEDLRDTYAGKPLLAIACDVGAMIAVTINSSSLLGRPGKKQRALAKAIKDAEAASKAGTPAGGIVTSPLRGRKGTMYDGGVRVPGVIEWPEAIPKPRVSDVNAVTSDILPTLCEIIGRPSPKRPLDGISLVPLIEGKMTERATPIGFWSFNTGNIGPAKPYIAPMLQQGTTPLVKRTAGGSMGYESVKCRATRLSRV